MHLICTWGAHHLLKIDSKLVHLWGTPCAQGFNLKFWLHCSSDHREACSDVKVQARDLVRVVGIIVPFAHWGWVPREISFYRAPGGNGTRRLVPGAPSSGTHGSIKPSSGPDRVGLIEGSCGYRARGVCIWGKFVLSKNLGYKHWGSPSS